MVLSSDIRSQLITSISTVCLAALPATESMLQQIAQHAAAAAEVFTVLIDTLPKGTLWKSLSVQQQLWIYIQLLLYIDSRSFLTIILDKYLIDVSFG